MHTQQELGEFNASCADGSMKARFNRRLYRGQNKEPQLLAQFLLTLACIAVDSDESCRFDSREREEEGQDECRVAITLSMSKNRVSQQVLKWPFPSFFCLLGLSFKLSR